MRRAKSKGKIALPPAKQPIIVQSSSLALRLDAGLGDVMLHLQVCRYGAPVAGHDRLVQIVAYRVMSRLGPNPEEPYENLAKWSNSICMNGRLGILDISLTGSACPGLISDCKVKKTKFGGTLSMAKLASYKTSSATVPYHPYVLPTVTCHGKEYTVDTRQEEFRNVKYGESPIFVPFHSDLGETLLGNYLKRRRRDSHDQNGLGPTFSDSNLDGSSRIRGVRVGKTLRDSKKRVEYLPDGKPRIIREEESQVKAATHPIRDRSISLPLRGSAIWAIESSPLLKTPAFEAPEGSG
jgi:hypothetical protein